MVNRPHISHFIYLSLSCPLLKHPMLSYWAYNQTTGVGCMLVKRLSWKSCENLPSHVNVITVQCVKISKRLLNRTKNHIPVIQDSSVKKARPRRPHTFRMDAVISFPFILLVINTNKSGALICEKASLYKWSIFLAPCETWNTYKKLEGTNLSRHFRCLEGQGRMTSYSPLLSQEQKWPM